MATNRVKVTCLECGKKFATANLCPSCPKCGGSDIEVREDAPLSMRVAAENRRRTIDALRTFQGLRGRML